MKNQEQGSPTQMVGQSAYRFPVSDTVQAILTPRQAERMAQYLDMLKGAGGATAGAFPAVAPPAPAERPAQEPTNATTDFQAQRRAERPRREARARLEAKRQEYREARRERRAQVQPPKATGQQTVTRWLARECEELAKMVEGMPANLEEAQRLLHGAQSARVHIQALADTLEPSERPTADQVAGEYVLSLVPQRGKGAGTDGPVRLWRLLHLLAIYKAERSKHHPSATQEVIHTAHELLAAALRVTERTISRWTALLQGSGRIEARAHYTDDLDVDTGEKRTRVDGMVYAVALQPGHTPRLTYGDLHHQYRNLPADRALGRTAFRYAKLINARQDEEKNMSGSNTSRGGDAGDLNPTALQVLQTWAVTPGGGDQYLDPRYSFDPDIISTERKTSLQAVIYDLPLLADEPNPDRRRVMVHHLSARIAATLNDQHSQAYYAGLIWQAIKRGWAGIQALAAQLARLEIDRREWGELRSPAALLVTRQRPA